MQNRILKLAFINLSLFFNLFCNQPRWDEKFDFENIENTLKTERIIALYKLKGKKIVNDLANFSPERFERNGKTKPYLAILESGLKCVLKVRHNSYAESAAFKASKFLGLKLVPPTASRKINDHLCSLQFFVEASSRKNEIYKKLEKVDEKSKSDAEIFLFTFGQKDSGGYKNKLVQVNGSKYNLALIDNELIGRTSKIKELRTKVFYRSTLDALKKLNFDALKEIWKEGYTNNDDKNRYGALFERTLLRVDHVFKAAQNGKIIEDL